MTSPSRIAKRLILPVLLAATFVGVQVVFALPPTPGFDFAPANPVCGQSVAFTSQATDPENDQMTVEWDFEYGGTPASFAGTATGDSGIAHTYTTAGTRNVAQRVTAGADPAQLTSKALTVGANVLPTAAIAPPPAAQAGQPVHLTGSGTDATGAIASYAWSLDGDNNFNDGTTAQVDHTFATVGSKPIALRVTDNCGGTTEATGTVEVGNTAPTASFTMSVSNAPATVVNPGTPVAFQATATDANNDTLSYHWDLDGNGVFDEAAKGETNTAAATQTYATAKTVVVKLRVEDGQTGVANVQQTLVVNRAPVGAFTITPEAPLVNEPVKLDAGPSFDVENNIAKYEWDFTYGGTPASFAPDATGVSTTHSFTTPGAKPIALRLTDDDGGVTIVPRTVTVQSTRPNAGLTFSPQNPLPGQAVTLTSTSTPSASPGAPSLVATQWDFNYQPTADFTLEGAGGSVVTSFATAGAHTVAVKVTETGGGFAIATATIVVNAPPQASFTVAPAKPAEGKETTFASTSIDPDGPLVKQEWDLNNDGTFERTGAVVSTTKLKKGARRIALRVTDAKGATSTSTQTVTVKPPDLHNPPNVLNSVSYAPRPWGIVLSTLTVKVPSKTSVAVSCKGRGCPRGTFRKHSNKKRAELAFGKVRGSLYAGATINVIYTKPGYMTGWDTIVIRGGNRRVLLREGCKLARAKKPKPCPSG